MQTTSVKVKFRPSSANGKEGYVYYQVIHKGTTRYVKTAYHLFPQEWNQKTQDLNFPTHADSQRRELLRKVGQAIERDLSRLGRIIARLERTGREFDADHIVALFRKSSDNPTLGSFAMSAIRQLRQIHKIRTAEIYTATVRSFLRFREGKDLPLDEMKSETMARYEAWLRANGNCPNTTSFYMRVLRAIYNRAVEEEIVDQCHPFKHVYTGVAKTRKRAISLRAVKSLKLLDLVSRPHLEFARDMFLFSFYTRGMSFVDMAYLRKSDLHDGVLYYRRRKTGQQLAIRWEKCMEELIAKYRAHTAHSCYLLPIITHPYAEERRQYRNALCRVNFALKEVAHIAGLQTVLSLYCARHTWASVAKSKHIPLSVISESMGHDSEKTTRVYLASLDTNVVDRANRLILKEL